MVRLLIVWTLLACGVAHAAALTARLDKSAVALGEAITLTLQSRETPLDTLDTALLDDAFEVFSRMRSQGADGDTLVLTLYPRRAGLLSVPALEVHRPPQRRPARDGDRRQRNCAACDRAMDARACRTAGGRAGTS